MKRELTLFEEILEQPEYQEVLSQLPDEERKELLATLKKMVDEWENTFLKPLENYKSK